MKQNTFLQRTCQANPAGENSSLIFTVSVKSVPLYNFKITYAVPHMAVKQFSQKFPSVGHYVGPWALYSPVQIRKPVSKKIVINR